MQTQRGVWMIALWFGLMANVTAQEGEVLEQGRGLTQEFYQEQFEHLWERFERPLKSHFGDVTGLRRFRERVTAQLGKETAVISESVDTAGASPVYNRTARFNKAPEPVLVQWSLSGGGSVKGLLVTAADEAPSEYLDYRTKTSLRLPFQGEWYVYWGGRRISNNHHARARDQRFAYDFLMRKKGESHSGNGTGNGDYYCFGEPVLAPGAGTVATAVDGIADNVPGEMNAPQPMGNYVVIDHGNGEFSFLAHLQRGSVAVSKGDEVSPGERLGACGNSGHSSEPHLHYHLQTTAQPLEGEGLPAQFQDYRADGNPVARGEPVRGQKVRNEATAD